MTDRQGSIYRTSLQSLWVQISVEVLKSLWGSGDLDDQEKWSGINEAINIQTIGKYISGSTGETSLLANEATCNTPCQCMAGMNERIYDKTIPQSAAKKHRKLW